MMKPGITKEVKRQLERVINMTKKRGHFILLAATGSLLLWLAVAPSSDHQRRDDIMPEIVFVAPESLRSSACPDNIHCLAAKALYVPAEHRIYLRNDWSADNFHDLGILLHEFVHHLQTVGKLHFPCETEIELPAYTIQEAFYRAQNRDPSGNVPSGFTRFTRYSCVAQE